MFYFRFIAFVFLKHFALIFLGLCALYLSVDALINHKYISSSNALGYLWYCFCTAANFCCLLSLMLAFISSFSSLLRENILLALHSLGLSSRAIFRPAFFVASLVVLGFIALSFTPFAYASVMKKNLLYGYESKVEDLFFKYEKGFIYVKNYRLGVMSDIRLLGFEQGELKEITLAVFGRSEGEKLVLEKVKIKSLPKELELDASLPDIKFMDKLELDIALFDSGFVSDQSALNIPALWDFYKLCKAQGLDSSAALNGLHLMLLLPFYPLPLLFIFYKYMPIFGRFKDLRKLFLLLSLAALLCYAAVSLIARLLALGLLPLLFLYVLFGALILAAFTRKALD